MVKLDSVCLFVVIKKEFNFEVATQLLRDKGMVVTSRFPSYHIVFGSALPKVVTRIEVLNEVSTVDAQSEKNLNKET